MTEVPLGRFARVLEQPAYVAVGFGVLGFQRAQVCRRSLQRRVGALAGTATATPKKAGADLGPVLEPLRKKAEQAAATVVGHFPAEAKDFLKAASDLATDMPREARGIVDEAMAVGRFALHVLRAPTARRTYP